MTAYTTPGLVASEVRATATFSSSTVPTLSDVTTWINEASREIEVYANQVYGSTVVTSELHDFSGLQNIFQFPINGLLSVDKIEYNINAQGVAASWVTLSEGIDKDYLVYLDTNEIQFVAGQNATLHSIPQYGLKRLRLSYTWGATSTPLEIERLCTLMVARRVISTLINYQANTKQGNIGIGPIRVSDPSGFSSNYLNQLSKDIMELRHDIGLDTKIYKSTRVYDTNVPGYVNGGYYGGGFYG